MRPVPRFSKKIAGAPALALCNGNIGDQQRRLLGMRLKHAELDDVLLELGRFDLIKLDVEGGELAALQGAAKVIERWNPAIIFECGPESWFAEQKLSRMDLYKFITQGLGYNILGFTDFLFNKGEMTYDEFRKCGSLSISRP